MFCSKKHFNMVNKTHHRALCAIFFRFDLSLEELLSLSNSPSIHTKHLQMLMTEIYKSINKLNPSFMWNLFEVKEVNYNLRSKRILKLPTTN